MVKQVENGAKDFTIPALVASTGVELYNLTGVWQPGNW
jgi:hypothetical protein